MMLERIMALALTVFVPAALRILPLRLTLALCDTWPRSPGNVASPAALARRVDRWMKRGRFLWRPTCLTRAVVLYTMMRQHGHAPHLHIGTRGSRLQFSAHAWVSLGGYAVAEPDPALDEYRPLIAHRA
jgi:Transglutaminase-like superfamily